MNDCYEGNDSSDEDMEAADSLDVCLEPSCSSSNNAAGKSLRVILIFKIFQEYIFL